MKHRYKGSIIMLTIFFCKEPLCKSLVLWRCIVIDYSWVNDKTIYVKYPTPYSYFIYSCFKEVLDVMPTQSPKFLNQDILLNPWLIFLLILPSIMFCSSAYYIYIYYMSKIFEFPSFKCVVYFIVFLDSLSVHEIFPWLV